MMWGQHTRGSTSHNGTLSPTSIIYEWWGHVCAKHRGERDSGVHSLGARQSSWVSSISCNSDARWLYSIKVQSSLLDARKPQFLSTIPMHTVRKYATKKDSNSLHSGIFFPSFQKLLLWWLLSPGIPCPDLCSGVSLASSSSFVTTHLPSIKLLNLSMPLSFGIGLF
jgi:hypothetical protein